MSPISVIPATGHQYVGSIKRYTDLEWSALFNNELQRRPNLMKGNGTVTKILLDAIYENYECMKMVNCTEMSHCITLTHVPFFIKCINDAFIIKQYRSLDSTSYSKTWL